MTTNLLRSSQCHSQNDVNGTPRSTHLKNVVSWGPRAANKNANSEKQEVQKALRRKKGQGLANAGLWPQVVLMSPPCRLPPHSGHTSFCDTRGEVNTQQLSTGLVKGAHQAFLIQEGAES